MVVTGLLAATSPAKSDPICDSLTAQLSSLPRSSGPPRTSSLIEQLRATQFAARQYRCGFRFFGPPPAPECSQINAHIAKLKWQLSAFGGQPDDSFGFQPFSDRKIAFQRQRITEQMAQNGCVIPQARPEVAGGKYRTLCVRTCDGYFFPISFSASRARLKVDEAVCKGMYPEGKAQLFINRMGEESDRAVSLKNEAYSAQPYAFAYRKTFSSACKAQLTAGLTALGDRFAAAKREAKTSALKGGSATGIAVVLDWSAKDPEIDSRIAMAKIGDYFAVVSERPVRNVGGKLISFATNSSTAAPPKLTPVGLATAEKPVEAEMLRWPFRGLSPPPRMSSISPTRLVKMEP